MFFQILSRNPDRNGNPYRLVTVYNGLGELIRLVESRSSSPRVRTELENQGMVEIQGFHLTPKEYRESKEYFRYSCELETSD